MGLLQRILECEEEDVDSIVEAAINEADKNAVQIKRLGFLENNKSNSVFKGFIPLKTRIKYSNFSMEDYGMESTDFIYEFAHFIRKYNINSKTALVHYLECFINIYFGYSGKINRETIFNEIAWQTTTTDEEYFKALENNKIGDLKGKGAAECTERAALAQQILSLFELETYYCMGCVDLGDRQEGHCFNIVKRKNDYALLDYSLPTALYNNEGIIRSYYPFIGELSNAEFLNFIDNNNIKSFDYYFYKSDGKKELTQTERRYVVGVYEMEKENMKGNTK